MLSGLQIRTARRLVCWSREILGQKASLPYATVAAVESSDGQAWLTHDQEAALRAALEAAGIEFTAENGDGAGVRLIERDITALPSMEPHE